MSKLRLVCEDPISPYHCKLLDENENNLLKVLECEKLSVIIEPDKPNRVIANLTYITQDIKLIPDNVQFKIMWKKFEDTEEPHIEKVINGFELKKILEKYFDEKECIKEDNDE